MATSIENRDIQKIFNEVKEVEEKHPYDLLAERRKKVLEAARIRFKSKNKKNTKKSPTQA